MRNLIIPFALLSTSLLAAADTVTPEAAWRQGWPSLAGPRGAFVPSPTTTPLLYDLNQATIAWQSEPLFGLAKIGSKGWRDAEAYQRNLGAETVASPAS